MTLPFENASWKDDDERSVDADDQQEGFVLGTDDKVEDEMEDEAEVAAAADEAPAEEMVVDDDEETEIEEEAPPELSFADDDEPASGPRSTVDNTERNAVRAVLVFLLLLIAGYGILTRALFASPALADRLLGPLPLIGRFATNRFLARDVALVGVRGGYQKIKGNKEVFVITGEAVSAAPVTLGTIEIRGQLLDGDGSVLVDKTIYCGNVVSTKLLNDLSLRQVSVLQKMAPPKQFGVKPGDSAGFVIVFTNPPKGVVELTAQVVNAQPQA